jgi:nucleoside-diphosphate-sugar epimerase
MSLQLITGGCGLLGRALATRLLAEGKKVRIYDMKSPPEEITDKVEFKQGDIRDRDSVIAACQGAEVVYHLAANMPQAKLPARGFWEINVGGMLNALEGSLKHGARRLVFASTIEIYGVHTEFPVTEDSELRFTGIYSRNKKECEDRLLEAREKHGIEAAFPRMPMIFGPGFWHEKSMLTLFRLIHRGWPIPVPGFPQAPWSVLSAQDAAQAFFLAGEVREADGEAFNIQADDVSQPYIEVLRRVIELAGSRSRPVLIPPRLVEAAIKFVEKYDPLPTPAELVRFAMVGGDYSIEKAKRILGYKPALTGPEAIFSAYKWFYPA